VPQPAPGAHVGNQQTRSAPGVPGSLSKP
jgi:hypothetical protein